MEALFLKFVLSSCGDFAYVTVQAGEEAQRETVSEASVPAMCVLEWGASSGRSCWGIVIMGRAGNWNGKGELADALMATLSVPGSSQKVCCPSLPDV